MDLEGLLRYQLTALGPVHPLHLRFLTPYS